MCDACLIESVKRRMLSRRDLLKGAAAGTVAVGAAAGALGGAMVPAARAATHREATDMTHELHEGFPTFSGNQQFWTKRMTSLEQDGYNVFELRVNEHTGTHMDAPLHFSADGTSVAEIPVTSLVCPLCVVDIREKAAADDDAQVTPDDLQAWIDANGEIPDNACVAMNSGWARHVDTDKFRNLKGDTMHFPGFHPEATAMLLETGTAGIAVDTLSLDHGMSSDFAVHYSWLPAGRWGLECIAGLDAMPPGGATLVVGAPKHRGGTGGPARVIALS